MRAEYNFNYANAVRGKYYKRVMEGSNVVLLDEDVAKAFPDSASVNKALRSVLKARRTKSRGWGVVSQTYSGSCHCRRVAFEVKGKITGVVTCNCSICSRIGALWHAAAPDQVRILTGEGDLGLYQFNTKVAKHYFCKHCGIHPLSRPRLDPRMWVVNVRCLDGVDAASLPVQPFDGVNWEASAKAFIEKLRR